MLLVELLIYRLYEVVQNYGYVFKSVINEKFGDGIMSVICFDIKVEKEMVEGVDWVVIMLRGKWYVFVFVIMLFCQGMEDVGWY